MRRKTNLGVLAVVFGILLLFSFSTASYAVTDAGQPLVDSAWLAKNKDKVIIVDVRNKGAYEAGHIPGAVNIPVNDLQSKPDAILYPVKKLDMILGEDGLNLGSDVVLCGAGREMAYLEYWMLDYLGMKRIHVLNGGIEAWKGEVSTAAKKLPPTTFKAKPDPGKYATTGYVRSHLHKPGVVILDVRTPGEYMGTDVRSLRGGHIPGAINMNYAHNFERGTTVLKPVSELARIYSRLSKKKEFITYCQTGTRAANAYFVLRMLGFHRVRNYDASWIVWGSDVSLPADDVSYFNFVPVIKAIKKMEKLERK
ncbi:MAG: sulfurtransferase [Nitrospiraceae bacterium]|nr:sulfurtransferase [Nitrospiraceae bacterium]